MRYTKQLAGAPTRPHGQQQEHRLDHTVHAATSLACQTPGGISQQQQQMGCNRPAGGGGRLDCCKCSSLCCRQERAVGKKMLQHAMLSESVTAASAAACSALQSLQLGFYNSL